MLHATENTLEERTDLMELIIVIMQTNALLIEPYLEQEEIAINLTDVNSQIC